MIKIENNTVTTQGDAVQLASEMAGVMCAVYREIGRQEAWEEAVALCVKAVELAIRNERIKPSELLAVIRKVEEVENVLSD